MRASSKNNISAQRIQADWTMLCGEIGERRAGSANERRAADIIATRLTAAGCTQVMQETFPCISLRSARVLCDIREGRRWVPVETAALLGAPRTPGGRPVEGEIVWLEMPEQARRLTRGSLRGRIVALFGPLPTELDHHKKLVAAQPAAVIHVDERLPFPWTKNDGVYPRWAQQHGMPPTITVPYMEAWRWRLARLTHVRVGVQVHQEETVSQNVIAELPGSRPQLPALVICAHHDTQCGNPGADDNGSGVMCVLELARVLATQPRRRTIRLISFGAEEQLSVGAAAYVRGHRRELKRTTGMVINFDSVSSPLGHFEVSCIGSAALASLVERGLSRHGMDAVLRRELTPFVDNFPFNSAGIPSLYFGRSNCTGGRWQHHSRHDTLENVSVDAVVRLLAGVTPLIAQLTRGSHWPFDGGLPAEQQTLACRLGRDLFGF